MAAVRRSPRLMGRRSLARMRTIKEHNGRIHWFLRQKIIHTALKVLVYEISGTRPRLLLLPNRSDWDPACGCPVYAQDLDTDDWFSGPQTLTSINHFPGTRVRLANGYDIVSASRPQLAHRKRDPVNNTLRHLFCVDWRGTLVVVKRARRHTGRAVHITSPEVSLINVAVERWIKAQPGIR